jgi:hypothetical protein
MNNLAYSTQDIDKIGSKAEEILRGDLGSDQPLAYTVNQPDAPKENIAASVAKAFSLALFGGKENILCNLLFNITAPRQLTVIITMNKMGIGCHAGSIVFITPLSKTTGSTVSMEGPKVFGSSKFTGGDSATRLNNNKELVKLTEKFARTKSDVGGGLKMERYVNIEPSETGSVLTIVTLPRAYSMGMKATTDAKDFITIASLIEQSL